MIKYLVQRILVSIITLFAIITFVFLLIRILPGDPAQLYAGENASQADIERLRVQMNLDKPLPIQYGIFLEDLAHGDLGTSLRTRQPVLDEISTRIPATLKLALSGIFLAVIVGIPLGLYSAIKRYSFLDNIISVFTLAGVAMPVYLLGLLLIILFAVKLHWLPAAGSQNGIKSLILPAITIASFSTALITRMTRASVLDVLSQEYVTTARAKGQKEGIIIFRHVLRNALIPVVTVVGLQFGNLLGGSILTETIFGWPGLGQLLTQSLFARDYSTVQGLVLIYAAMFIVVNFIVDILYSYIDPRIRYD